MDTKAIREQAGVLLNNAEIALKEGKVDEFERIVVDAQAEMKKADDLDAAQKQLKALRGDFNQPVNTVPVASTDVEKYDPNDTAAKTKANHKPSSWVKGLPAHAQPIWVQEKMGDNLKAEAEYGTEVFEKWMRSISEQSFYKSASLDEVKAMEEGTDAEGGFFVPEQFVNQVIHDPGVPGSLLRPISTVVRVSSKDGYIPTLAGATWAAIDEEAAFSDQTPTVGQVAFDIEKSGGLVTVSYTHLTLPTKA